MWIGEEKPFKAKCKFKNSPMPAGFSYLSLSV